MHAHPVPYVWGWYFTLELGGIPLRRLNGSSSGGENGLLWVPLISQELSHSKHISQDVQ